MALSPQFDAFHEQAMKAAGLEDFGAADYVESMQLALADYDEHNRFPPLGEQMVGGRFVGELISRLFAQQGFKSHPEFSNAPIEQPIVIIGLPRTGSTALHRLLCHDPATQWLPPWLGQAPMPRPPRADWESNPWYRRIKQGFDQLYQINPGIKQTHPMLADEPDECRFALDQSFWSPSYAVCASAPRYAQWCLDCDASYAYRRYRRILGLVAGGSDKRWILKDPAHLWGLDALLKVFPDACIVYTHRDPVAAMTSMAGLIYEWRRVIEPGLVRRQFGKTVMELWGQAQTRAEAVRDRHDSARFFDVHIREIEADAAGVAQRIYRHFDVPVAEEAQRNWLRYVASEPETGHGARYRPEDFGFTSDDVYAATGAYCKRYLRLYEGNK